MTENSSWLWLNLRVVLITLARFAGRICDDTNPNLSTTGSNTTVIFQKKLGTLKPISSVCGSHLSQPHTSTNKVTFLVTNPCLFSYLYPAMSLPPPWLFMQFLLNIFLLCNHKPLFFCKQVDSHLTFFMWYSLLTCSYLNLALPQGHCFYYICFERKLLLLPYSMPLCP